MIDPLELVKLTPLMEQFSGNSDILIGLIDGPVAIDHPDLSEATIRAIPERLSASCAEPSSAACMHGTFVTGILCAKREAAAPSICPNCTILVRPIFTEITEAKDMLPIALPYELAEAIADCIDAGVHAINLSSALVPDFSKAQNILNDVLDYAATRGVLIVAAAGNHGMIGSSAITRHPSVIPVVAYDLRRRPMGDSNLSSTIGKRGLGAPGEGILSLGADGKPRTMGGTSVAAPFVTGAIALLWSAFPGATAAKIRCAVTQASTARRHTVVPPLLNAWSAYESLRQLMH